MKWTLDPVHINKFNPQRYYLHNYSKITVHFHAEVFNSLSYYLAEMEQIFH